MKIVADIGGTNLRIAGSNDLLGFTEPLILGTPQEYGAAIAVFTDAARRIAGNERIDAVQIGIRGTVSKENGSITDTVLSDWSEKPLAHDLRVALSIPTVNLENDVATVAMGEAHFGAGKDARIMVYITVSTGVNGCRVSYGKLEPNTQGFEIGGQYVNIDPTITFEEMVSGTTIERHFGKHPKDLGKDNPIWNELAELTAYGVHNTILHWSPDTVVLGGSMFNDIGIPVPLVALGVKKIMKKFPMTPQIVHSSLGDIGGLWGGLALLRQSL
jgi:predicted NBD/HSP70 family sugar kinase